MTNNRRWAAASALLVLVVLGLCWATADATRQKRDAEPDRTKAAAKMARELQGLQGAFPQGKTVTIFSKDYGPVEGVVIVKVVSFQGAGFFHLRRAKDGKNMLIRYENITYIRED
jgi:hypothetical protein